MEYEMGMNRDRKTCAGCNGVFVSEESYFEYEYVMYCEDCYKERIK